MPHARGTPTRIGRLGANTRPMATSVTPEPLGSAPLSEHQRRGREVGRVLVLNATYEPINVCTVRRAVTMKWRTR